MQIYESVYTGIDYLTQLQNKQKYRYFLLNNY